MNRNTHAPGRKCPASKSDFTTRRADYALANPQGERRGLHQFGVPPKPAQRDSANLLPEGKPQVVSEARDNNANFAWVHHFIHHQSRTPATLRDTLLPKLLSGEITIPAAE